MNRLGDLGAFARRLAEKLLTGDGANSFRKTRGEASRGDDYHWRAELTVFGA